jgi:hypothetical protein
MASTPSSQRAPIVVMDIEPGRSSAAIATLRVCWGASARSRSGIPALSGGKAPLTAARRRRVLRSSGAQLVFETPTLTDCRCSSSASHSGSCSPIQPALYLDGYRADYGAGDDINPLATHAEGEGRWNRCCRVEANPAPPSPWRCERVREIERPVRTLRYDTGPHDGVFGRRTGAATYERKATVAAKAVAPLSTTYATRAEQARASPLRCHARAVTVGTRPWVMDVR